MHKINYMYSIVSYTFLNIREISNQTIRIYKNIIRLLTNLNQGFYIYYSCDYILKHNQYSYTYIFAKINLKNLLWYQNNSKSKLLTSHNIHRQNKVKEKQVVLLTWTLKQHNSLLLYYLSY